MSDGNKERQGSTRRHATVQRVCLISTLLLSTLLLIYLAVTIFGMSKLNSQIKLTTEHPFVVSRYVGEVQVNVAQMRVRTERLQSYNQATDIKRVKDALDELYEKIEQPLAEIQRLYLGPKADAALLQQTFNRIRLKQKNLLEYAAAGHTKEEITEYEQIVLYPLYDTMEEGSAAILSFTQNTQMTVYASADALWRTTLVWSIIIVALTIIGLLAFQYILWRMNREIYDKNQQFDTLSQTIDETFLIFEEGAKEADFVAGNAQRVLGIAANALKRDRQLFYQYVDEQTREKITEKLCSGLAESPWEAEIQYHRPETQEECWLLARFYRSTNKAGHVRHIVTLVDRTNELRARQALQDALSNAQNANNAKRDFLSRMSHEIRTPMNAIIGMTTIAAASMDDRPRVEDCLIKIGYSSKHLLMLINDVLDMSRIESNKMTLRNEPFDLYQFINSFVSVIYSQAQSKGVEFTEKMVGFSENATYVGDSFRLNQILLNLVSNAIKFTAHGGKVALEIRRFSSRDVKERICFTVTDTGIGMSADALRRIYDPFDQADTSIAQKYGGTGLGMSITKNLVSLMGGFIDVKSRLGEGTVCVVELPFEKSNVELESLPTQELESLHVLVVDDEKDVCEHTTLLLTKINLRAEWVLSGMEAVDRVAVACEKGDNYDICFIDWKMPGMDGIETTRRIRERVGSATPIIILSAYDWSEIEQEARDAGANAFVSKPLFLSSVYNVLVNVTNGAFARTAAQKPEEKIALDGKTILITEDNALNLEIAEELLKMNGAKVESAKNGQEAVDKFLAAEPGHYDAILMDIQMPVMNGYEATQRIRSLERADAKLIPIIATTANAFTEDMSAALAAGMNAHTSKPIDIKRLCQVLSQWMH